MSIWTHVIGSFVTAKQPDKIKQAMGEPILWEDAEEVYRKFGIDSPEQKEFDKKWKAAFHTKDGIPMGSEGSLNYYIIQDSNKDHVAGEGTNVIVQGDLRDFSDLDRVVKWIEKFTKEIFIRDGIFKIYCEWGETLMVSIYWSKIKVTKIEKDENL